VKKVFFILLLIPFIGFAQLKKEVLFVGNSYTYVNDLPNLVKQIALSFGDTLLYESSTPGGSSFSAHSTNTQTLSKINQQQWDYVVLQAQSQEPSLSPGYVNANVLPAAQILIDAIESNSLCIEPLFFMTWGRKFGDASNCVPYPPVCTYLGMQERLRTRYLDMSFTDNASCSPVGMAWKKSIAQNPSLELYSPDESHPSIYGSYLAACTFYATIFKKSAVGSTYWPNAIDSATAYSLQQIGSSTVLDSLGVWNIFSADFTYNQIGDSVSFSNQSSNYESVLWDFGDGQTSTLESPTHVYTLNGSYTVTLTAFTNTACVEDTHTISITVNIISTGIEQIKVPSQLLEITDVLGRKTNPINNVPLFYRFDDGTVEKRINLDY